jgi:hypothetical protein
MMPYRDSRFTYAALLIFFIIAIGYAYAEARGLLFGPSINVTSQIAEVHDPYVKITGQANRIASLSMNGKSITVTEAGVFEEPYLLAPGLNHIVLDAKDKYGRTSSRTIDIVYTPSSATVPEGAPATSTAPLASSTPSVAQ